MKYPNFGEEKRLWRDGYKIVVGLDEAGRGPLAGPVVAAAVTFNFLSEKHSNIQLNIRMFNGIRDSKRLSAKQRQKFYQMLTKSSHIEWGIGVVSEKVIDRINILEATKLAMRKSLDNLYHKFLNCEICGIDDFLIIDGNFGINAKIPQKSIVAADQKVFSCVAAGIIAKVTRDRLMMKFHQKYPQYGFHKHKGYGTKLHIRKLAHFGPCKIHRRSFFPVKNLAKREFI